MRKAFGLILWGIAAVVVTAVVIGALSHTSASSGPAASPSSTLAPSQAVAPVAAASSGPCTTKDCIVDDAKDNLVGGLATDNAVMTSLSCSKPTVKHAAPASGRCTARRSTATG